MTNANIKIPVSYADYDDIHDNEEGEDDDDDDGGVFDSMICQEVWKNPKFILITHCYLPYHL